MSESLLGVLHHPVAKEQLSKDQVPVPVEKPGHELWLVCWASPVTLLFPVLIFICQVYSDCFASESGTACWHSHLRSNWDSIGKKKKGIIQPEQNTYIASRCGGALLVTSQNWGPSAGLLAKFSRCRSLRYHGFSPCRALQKRKKTLEVDPDCYGRQCVVGRTFVCHELLSGASQLHLQGKIDWSVCILHINTMQEQPVSCSNTSGEKRLLLPDNQINQDALGNKR